MAIAARRVVDKRSAVIEAAVALFARKGFEGTTVPEIAERAGVATGSIYVYFASKEALVNAAIVERKQAMFDSFVAAVAAGGDRETRFRRAWRALIAYAIAHPDDFRFFELHHHESYLDAASRAVGDRLMAAATNFMVEIAGKQLDGAPSAEALVSLVWGAMVGLLKSADQGYIKLDPQLVDAASATLWRAVAGAAPAPSPSSMPLRDERTKP